VKIRTHEKHATKDEELVALMVPLQAGEWHGCLAEALWAEKVERGYLLRSSPFHAFDLAAEDIVAASEIGGVLTFEKVIERGGGSNYRLVSERGAAALADRLEALEELEVSYEISDTLIALDVPPQADLDAVYGLLVDGEEEGAWTFEEGHVSEDAA